MIKKKKRESRKVVSLLQVVDLPIHDTRVAKKNSF